MTYHRDDRAREPTMIHTSYGDGENLCNADTYPWPERCMDDSFARTLPACPNCVEIAELTNWRHSVLPDLTAGIIAPTSPVVVVDKPPKRHGPIYLIDYLEDTDTYFRGRWNDPAECSEDGCTQLAYEPGIHTWDLCSEHWKDNDDPDNGMDGLSGDEQHEG